MVVVVIVWVVRGRSCVSSDHALVGECDVIAKLVGEVFGQRDPGEVAVGRLQSGSIVITLFKWRGKTRLVTIKFKSESPSFEETLNQVSSVFLLMTSLTALANEGLLS